MTKYHINKNGEAKECKAKRRSCRFTDDQHFDNFAEAQEHSEKKLSQQYKNESLTKKSVSDKDTSNKIKYDLKDNGDHNDLIILRDKIRYLVVEKPKSNTIPESTMKKLEELDEKTRDEIYDGIVKKTQSFSYSPDDIMAVGKLMDDELQKRLPFDIANDDLSDEQLNMIHQETHKLFSSLVKTGSPAPNKIYGTMNKKMQNAIAILPNNVKNNLSHVPLLVKATRLDNNQFDGIHKPNVRFSYSTLSTNNKMTEYEKEQAQDIPVGETYMKGFVFLSDIEDEYSSTIAQVKTGEDTYDNVWIGNSKGKHVGKKISDTVDVYVNNKKQTLNKPVYEYKIEQQIQGNVILAKKMELEDKQRSVLLHEYVHLVQQYDHTASEQAMFRRMADTTQEHDYGNGDGYYEGFPDEYMGLKNGRELLTRATEGLFEPAATNIFYGKRRGKNADEIRQWVMGYWLSKGELNS